MHKTNKFTLKTNSPNHKICVKCKKQTDPKKIVPCHSCKLNYHLNCDGYPEKLFHMKDAQGRESWKCKTCTAKGYPVSSKPIPVPSNITIRKNRKYQDVTQESPPNEMNPNFTIPLDVDTSKEQLVTMSAISTPDPDLKLQPVSQPDQHIEVTTEITREQIMSSSSDTGSRLSTKNESLENATQLYEKLSKSADFSMNEMLTILELKEKIDHLSAELTTIQDQFDDISIENNGLRRRIDRLESENATLKTLCCSTNFSSIPQGKKKTRYSMHMPGARTDFSPVNSSSRTSSPDGLKSYPNSINTTELLNIKKIVENLEEKLVEYKEQVSILGLQLKTILEDFLYHNATENLSFRDKSPLNNQACTPKEVEGSVIKSKLCLISNHTNYMLQLIKKSFPGENACLYLTPGAGTQELFHGLQYKLRDFTLNDFCIINIGDKDFKRSVNYNNLICYIQNQLTLVQHTNIIICLPTFKINSYSNLYIKRVETFNNLLYANNLTYRYSYILDSNRNLSYDSDMFTKLGNVNRLGFITIFNDLIVLLNAIQTHFKENKSEMTPHECKQDTNADKTLLNMFFRN